MKTDSYIKIVLTVIAVCLTINVLKDLEIVQTVHAKANKLDLTSPQSSTVDVKIVNWSSSDAIPVKVYN